MFVENISKMATAGAVSYPIMSYFYGGKVLNTNILGQISLPLALAIGSAIAFTSSEFLHEYIMPQLHVSERLSTPISAGVNVATNYAMTNVALGLMNMDAPAEIGQTTLLLSSGASVMASSYIFHTFVAPMYGFSSSASSGSYY
jgi:hypothetical protein